MSPPFKIRLWAGTFRLTLLKSASFSFTLTLALVLVLVLVLAILPDFCSPIYHFNHGQGSGSVLRHRQESSRSLLSPSIYAMCTRVIMFIVWCIYKSNLGFGSVAAWSIAFFFIFIWIRMKYGVFWILHFNVDFRFSVFFFPANLRIF